MSHNKVFFYGKVIAANLGVYALSILGLAYFRHIDWTLTDLAISFTTFTGGTVIGLISLRKRWLPRPVLWLIDKMEQSSARELLRRLMHLVLHYPILSFGLLAMTALANNAPAVESLPHTAQTVYNTAFILGTGWIGFRWIYCVINSLHSNAHYGEPPKTNPFADSVQFLEQYVLLSLCLMGVRFLGVEMADLLVKAQGNLEYVFSLIAAYLIVNAALALAPSRSYYSAPQDHGMEYAAYGMAIKPRMRQPQDIYRTSVHEAGHLLMYAALPQLPDDLSVQVKEVLGLGDDFRGRVFHSDIAPESWSESHLHWMMLLHLAGAEAEFTVFGERADGASEDNQHWITAATMFLASGFGEVFFQAPISDEKLAHNRVVLNDLKAKHVAEVQEFLAANKELLEELAGAIAQQKNMDRSLIEPYLARARMTVHPVKVA
ncbi:hypothetical protein ACFFU8_08900 [Chromobacterium piscinae]|uniref:hypothetical protein n=1 Tax=Chromobacterium piscinae TaxID=686831 RepID=UPI001E621A6E|nr:hypothetical protein [Chromobacterium piscinae]MCD5327978.1 hypothetical protein [Chromobacterium piscinae]